jgi:FHA domain
MTTQAPTPARERAATQPLQTRPTESLDPGTPELTLDALPLLDHRTRGRTIRSEHALRGSYLAFKDGDEKRLLRLDQQLIHLGRGPIADVRFEEHHISRDHAMLVRIGGVDRVLDNRSSNGTFVNGQQIIATNLADGDVIRLGPIAFQYLRVP